MNKATVANRLTSCPGSAQTPALAGRVGPLSLLALSAWCGLAAGWLEVGTRVLCRSINPTNRLYMMSRHFVWLTPLANLLLFFGMGCLLALVTWLGLRRGGWISLRLLGVATVLPALIVAGPRVYTAAWLTLAMGIAVRLVPWLERTANRSRRWFMFSFPFLLGLVPVAAGVVSGEARLREWREAHRALPSADSPNVLLIVLDTVRADRLSLHGYYRPTTPALERLARRGIRFDEARATAPWTLPSHASMFTGRWPHELAAKWMSPLGVKFPTLAEYLGAHGYATAGFVGNTLYCSYDTGLDRGFTHYEDYVVDLHRLRFLQMALLVDRARVEISNFGFWLYHNLAAGPVPVWMESVLRPLLVVDRKDAGSINRDFLEWLSHRQEPDRPFFVFLNYYDTHSPYRPPEGAVHRFGLMPQTDADYFLLTRLWAFVDKLRLTPHYRLLFEDSYDNCIGYLDERLGDLFDALAQRGVLERTLVIVTADHGEELGEHALFDHGESLYRPEIRVPLLFVLPARSEFSGVVKQAVSLRDLPATIVELVGLAAGSPFPGRSLAGLWRHSPHGEEAPSAGDLPVVLSELADPNPALPSQGRSPASRGPLVSLAEGDFVYIRNEAVGSEELFNESNDPHELINRTGTAAMQPVLKRFRQHLDQMRPRPANAVR